MAEIVEPERSDPSGWLGWIAALVGLLAGALILSVWVLADQRANTAWLVAGIVALLLATLGLPAWGVVVNDD